MSKLTEFSMKNITALFIIILLLLSGGAYSASTLKVENMPDVSMPIVSVITTYPAPPKDVLEDVTKPLEKAFSGMEGVKNLTSSSSDNFSRITLEFEQDKDPKEMKRDVESLISNVDLPDAADNPQVITQSFGSMPVYYMAIYGKDGMNQDELDKLYRDVMLPELNSIKGIDKAESIGNSESVLSIKLDVNALNNYRLTPEQVTGYVQAGLVSAPAGSVDLMSTTQMVRVKGNINTVYELENLEFTTADGDVLRLSDVGRIEAIQESDFYSRLNGQSAISVHLYKARSTNTVEFAEEVDKKIAKWEQTMSGVSVYKFYNDAADVKQSIHGMLQEGALGAILASGMILFFLRNLRMTLIVLVSIPLSIITTLLFMGPLGISLNIMTLGGMAIAIGRVVDDSIVVIENIYVQLQRAQQRGESVIKLATQQVSSAITSSTLTTVGVFGPIAMVSGTVGEVFRPFAITLAVALLSSLLVAVTVIPMLAKLLVMNSRIPYHDESKVGWSAAFYQKVLVWSLNNRFKTMGVAALIFVLTFAMVTPQLAVSFMPDQDSDTRAIGMITMPLGTSFETMDAKVLEIEQMMRSEKDAQGKPVFDYIQSLVGYSQTDTERIANKTMMYLAFAQGTDNKQAVKDYQEKILYLLPQGSKAEVMLIAGGAGAATTDFSYQLKGEDINQLRQAALLVSEKLTEFPDLVEIKDGLGDQKSEVEIVVEPTKAKIYGLTSGQVQAMVASWINVTDLGKKRLDDVQYETKVEIDDQYKNTISAIENFSLHTPSGVVIQLKDIAKVREVEASATIDRDAQVQAISVTANIDSADKGGISNKVAAELSKLELPPGVTGQVKGVSDDINQGFMQMFVAMGASIFIVYLIMVLAFGNASAPFAILFSLPLAAIGGLLGLFLTNESLNITSLIGFLMLIGIVVTNAIVLVDRVQQLREKEYSVRDALVEAGMTRLRPIIMTAGATILALMPLALGLSKGTIISKGLAVVVIGGLTTSTFLTLLIVPIVYEMIYAARNRISRLFKRKSVTDVKPVV
ncbi:efflux RND transporter permease subunit [Brevibacillus dissolubilis]|uniref:efflux RND transporter permease subunit n=1 Tax=Brevibacillus dissolubilis TaxID=1844116 RepID=UPI0011161E07|nr:efflux RND transporter permease subunit [Brevibacillus dissolubilis]